MNVLNLQNVPDGNDYLCKFLMLLSNSVAKSAVRIDLVDMADSTDIYQKSTNGEENENYNLAIISLEQHSEILC